MVISGIFQVMLHPLSLRKEIVQFLRHIYITRFSIFGWKDARKDSQAIPGDIWNQIRLRGRIYFRAEWEHNCWLPCLGYVSRADRGNVSEQLVIAMPTSHSQGRAQQKSFVHWWLNSCSPKHIKKYSWNFETKISAHDDHGLDLCCAYHRCGEGTSNTSSIKGKKVIGFQRAKLPPWDYNTNFLYLLVA